MMENEQRWENMMDKIIWMKLNILFCYSMHSEDDLKELERIIFEMEDIVPEEIAERMRKQFMQEMRST